MKAFNADYVLHQVREFKHRGADGKEVYLKLMSMELEDVKKLLDEVKYEILKEKISVLVAKFNK